MVGYKAIRSESDGGKAMRLKLWRREEEEEEEEEEKRGLFVWG